MPRSADEARARREAGESWSNKEIRDNYNQRNREIAELNEQWKAEGMSAEQRARKAHELRHEMRMVARDMMGDSGQQLELLIRDAQKYGDGEGPSFEQLVQSQIAKGKTGDEIYESIIGSAQRTDKATNEKVESGADKPSELRVPPDVVVRGDGIRVVRPDGQEVPVRIKQEDGAGPARVVRNEDGTYEIRVGKDAPRDVANQSVADAVADVRGRILSEETPRPAVNDPPTPPPDAAVWVTDLRSRLTPEQQRRLELMTAGKSDAEIFALFGGDPDVAIARLGGSNLPNDLILIRNRLTPEARRGFDEKWNRMVGGSRNPPEQSVSQFRNFLDAMARRANGDMEAGLAKYAESIPSSKPVDEPRMDDYPPSWKNFQEAGNAEFKTKLEELRGTDNIDSKFMGGEGIVFRIDETRAAKRWFASRVADIDTSLQLLRDARAAVEGNPALSEHVQVVRIHERGSDWIVRDWVDDSAEISRSPASEPARLAAIQALESKPSRSPIEDDLLNKLRNKSANLHWSPSLGKIVVIDMM